MLNEVVRERCVCSDSVVLPPNQRDGIATITAKEQWEYCGTNEVEITDQ